VADEVKPGLVPLWPYAGRRLGYRSRTAAYRAADNGVIRLVRLGRLKRVPTEWLERKVAGEDEGEAA
jgi:hypothetical protein